MAEVSKNKATRLRAILRSKKRRASFGSKSGPGKNDDIVVYTSNVEKGNEGNLRDGIQSGADQRGLVLIKRISDRKKKEAKDKSKRNK